MQEINKVKEHKEVITHLCEHYSKLVRLHGDKPQAVQYTDKESHWRRFQVLTDIGIWSNAKIVDFGCGTGELLRYLLSERSYSGEYIGIDISEEQLALARKKFPDVRFVHKDVLQEGLGEEVDFVIINGVFNNSVPGTDSFAYMCDILRSLMPQVSKGIAFNGMSTYVDFFDESLSYFDPGTVFNFCKEHLSNYVTLRHDYNVTEGKLPFEFCMYVYKDTSKSKRNLAK